MHTYICRGVYARVRGKDKGKECLHSKCQNEVKFSAALK